MKKETNILKNIIFVIMFYLLLFSNALDNFNGKFGMIDEAISFIFLVYGVCKLVFGNKKYSMKKNDKQISIGIILIGIIGLVGNILYKYQNPVPIIKDGVVVVKGIITYVCIPIIFMDSNISDYLEVLNKHLKIISTILLVTVLANFVLKIFPCYEVRFGIESQQIFFSHPTYLASASAMLMALLSVNLKKHKENIIYIVMALITLASTLRFKSIAFIPVYLYMVYTVIIKERKLQIKHIVVLCILGSAFAMTEIMEYVQNPDWARSALNITSLKIGADHFPFGTGFGTYAGWASGESYSIVYNMYRLDKIWGLGPDFCEYVADTFWPMIIGQFGFIGFAIYIFIIYKIYRNIKENNDLYYYFGQILLLFYLLILSMAEASLSGPIVVIYMMMIALLGKNNEGTKSFSR